MKLDTLFKIINIFLILLIIGVFGTNLYLSDQAATAGDDLAVYQEQIDDLQKEHDYLQNEYLKLTSLSTIQEKATELGYVSTDIEYYSNPSMALNNGN